MIKRKLFFLPILMLSIGVLSSCSDNGVSSKLDDLQNQIDDLKNEVAELKTQISDLRTEMQEADAVIRAEYDQQISDINDEIDALNTQLEELTVKFETDKETVQSDYNTKISNLKDYTDGKVAELEAALELDYNTKISNLTTTYKAKVAEIEDSITACNNAISALEAEMAAVLLETQNDYNSKINALTNRVAALETVTYHTVTFDTGVGSAVVPQVIAHNEKVTKPVEPTRPGYTFEGWTYNGNPWVFYGYVVSEDMTLTAVWEAIDYTVTFKNDDGSVLEVQTPVHYGDSITYHGDIPVKPDPTDHYIYTFDGWDVDLTNITGDTVAVAQYTSEYAPYTAYFYDDEDNLLCSVLVREGETATYPGETPTKKDDNVNKLQFQFSGWDEIDRTTDTISYKVHFESCTKGLIFENNTVYQYAGSSTNVVVPAVWNNKSIIAIGNGAFTESNIVSVSLPDGLKTIGLEAFSRCLSLSELIIPDSVESISDYAFSNCESLKTIVIPDSVTSVGTYAFSDCSSLKSVNYSNNISFISSYAFYRCTSLLDFVIPPSVKTIRSGAFMCCGSLKSITIPNTVETIEIVAFFECNSLSYVIIPKSVVNIGGQAFGGGNSRTCYSIYVEHQYKPLGFASGWCYTESEINNSHIIWGYKSLVTGSPFSYVLSDVDDVLTAHLIGVDEDLQNIVIPNYVDDYPVVSVNPRLFANNANIQSVYIPEGIAFSTGYAFQNSTSLESVRLPSTLTAIGDNSFAECDSLRYLELPSDVTKIGRAAFSGSGLVSIVIPKKLETIEEFAFNQVSSLKNIYYCGNSSDWSNIQVDVQNNDDFTKATHYYYSESEPVEPGNYWHYVEGVPTVW